MPRGHPSPGGIRVYDARELRLMQLIPKDLIGAPRRNPTSNSLLLSSALSEKTQDLFSLTKGRRSSLRSLMQVVAASGPVTEIKRRRFNAATAA